MKRALLIDLQILAGNRCDYCRVPEVFDPLPFQVNHIIAQQHHGRTILENLARISHRALKRIAFWGHKLLATTNFLVSQKAVR